MLGQRGEVGLFLAADSSHLCVGHLLFLMVGVFFFLVVVTLANSHLDEYQRQKVMVLFLGQKYDIVCMYWSNSNLLGVLSLIFAAEVIAH